MIKNRSLITFFLLSSVSYGVNCFASTELDDSGWDESEWSEESSAMSQWDVTGFAEAIYGEFTGENPVARSQSIKEARIQVAITGYLADAFASFKGDIVRDVVLGDSDLDVREFYLDYSPITSLDIRAGRQILTWGTGDQIFLNDLFAKDAHSLFSGRDIGYLKAPTDALRASFFTDMMNTDFVWTPDFTPDTVISGQRFSYFSPPDSRIVGSDSNLKIKDNSKSEFALRVYRDVGSSELAGYLYRGYYKKPLGFDPATMTNTYPRLNSFGASIRGTTLGGVGNIEASWYRSVDDLAGTDPFLPNSQFRFLIGYVKEVIPKFELGLQYYLEWIEDYEELIENSVNSDIEASERRHTITMRLTYRAMLDKLTLSLFTQASPDESDYYLSPSLSYSPDDTLTWMLSANIFGGRNDYTALGQLTKNDNVSLRIRVTY